MLKPYQHQYQALTENLGHRKRARLLIERWGDLRHDINNHLCCNSKWSRIRKVKKPVRVKPPWKAGW